VAVILLALRSPRALSRFVTSIGRDWTRLSFALYGALPLSLWWLAREPYSRTGDLFVSTLVLAGGALAYMRSQEPWQRAIALQVGMTLAPVMASVVSAVFWSEWLDWAHGQPLPGYTLAALYTGLASLWLGPMFAPALLVLFRRGRDPGRPASF
jgi:hypothetical protein